ncbi:MAG: molybdenum ABC transporter ATP-binding protein [Cypionkella sp.]|uniref:molybdenum ABC transporter ATP-binding protein n=1 Tax=Cypionkella sp. TaxID=2811411 RepID=UPI002ABC25B0|nr:molybdenum ABC transporter ATP-binding protein [Cypionkella sp.]MDZ4311635.1 molybdenum ABC transporter ATP-binding protein [Cypionkella sp.]
MTLSVALTHQFPGFTLDVAFEAPPGLTALFGKSGSGKTSVINAVAGILHPHQGRITAEGTTLLDTAQSIDLPTHRRHLGYVFQDARLFPHLSVRQNLTYGRWFAPRTNGPAFDDIITLLGLDALLNRRPGALSGGEKSRVAIGRALLSNPALLLMDEPFAALDEARKAELLPYIETLRDHTKIPILYVSHALAEVARLATTIVVLDHGKILRAGPAADLLADPDLAPSLGLRDAGAILTATVTAQDPDGLTQLHTHGGPLWLPKITAAPGTALRIRIAAQDVILSRSRPEGLSALNILHGTVSEIRLSPDGALIQIAIGPDHLLARITHRSATALGLTPGQAIFAIVKSVAAAQTDIGTRQEGAA